MRVIGQNDKTAVLKTDYPGGMGEVFAFFLTTAEAPSPRRVHKGVLDLSVGSYGSVLSEDSCAV